MAAIGFVSLGCPKALVDAENIITSLKTHGYEIVDDYKFADLVIVNTCGFIESAIKESLDSINEAMLKNGKVIVTGCLGANAEVIRAANPNILGITGPDSVNDVMNLVFKHLPIKHEPFEDLLPAQGVKLTPNHYAYLKISEGCNNTCSFCIIPSMRGKLKSYAINKVLTHATYLKNAGYKELLVISQDTGAYGVDVKYKTDFFNGKPIKTKFIDLCQELGNLGLWIRLHYIYPYPHIDEVIPLMALGKILPYLDIPLQHASPRILYQMKRPANIENMVKRINNWRQICPDISLRSTFIVGFPGETEDDFQCLLDFLTEIEFDKVGCFMYSPVASAAANDLLDQVPEEIKIDRYNRFMQHQAQISKKKLLRKVGKELEIIIDEIRPKVIVGRTKYDAPEIDGLVFVKYKSYKTQTLPNVGDIVNVKIIKSEEYDLHAELVALE